MRKFHSITALCGDGLRPELQALFDRLAIDPRSELFVRDDGMVQAGPDPASETVLTGIAPLTKKIACIEVASSSANVRSGSGSAVGRRNRDFRSSLNSRHS
jgi:hypothetical protein